jgi:hypothetical protein
MPRMDELHEIEGYMRCLGCGVLVPDGFARQTGKRCEECWRLVRPLAQLEVMANGKRVRLRSSRKETPPPEAWKKPGTREGRALREAAKFAAWRRLAIVHQDLFRMFYDEERVKRGLHPVARYNPIDFDRTSSETLAFDDVYDALRSSGATDGP